jgi:diguanylate cyclase (GGDEF)-like protein
MRRGLRERFYRSVAETLALLHTAPGYDRKLAFSRVAQMLSSIMELPLVWIGRVEPDSSSIQVYAAAGAAADYAACLQLSVDEDGAGGQGPTAVAIREARARVTRVDAPEFAPWREAAESHGLGWYVVAATTTNDGGRLTLSAYARPGPLQLGAELLDWAQRLADQLGRFWDHQTLLEREVRLRRYRDAQRAIQRALLEQPDPAAVYRTLAQALVEVAGAAAVDVLAGDQHGRMLRRMALVGPLAEAITHLPHPPCHSDGPVVYTPTLAFMRGTPVVRVHPSQNREMDEAWANPDLAGVGAIGCWPLFAAARAEASAHGAVGVFVVVAREQEAFDAEMCNLLDEIADAAGLALKQHDQRRVLFEEQARQTYLALHDDLTHLPNRRALDRHLERVLDRASRQQRLVAVGMLDVDDLKLINDRYGHATGDMLLGEVAHRVRAALRNGDYVARQGGDEFVLVFENLDDVHDLDPLLERVRHALQQPMLIDGVAHECSVSLGVALYPLHADASGAQLLRRADQAMYAVKTRKRTRASWWALPQEYGQEAQGDAQAMGELRPHGPTASALLRPHFAAWAAGLPALVDRFYEGLCTHEGVHGILQTLPPNEAAAVRRRMVQHVRGLLSPRLTLAAQRESAMRSGVFNAAWGLEEVWLLEAIEQLRTLLGSYLGANAQGDRRPLETVLQRLTLERQWQLESMRELQRRRVALLGQLNVLAWSADSYLEFAQGVVDILASHAEIAACAVGRPDQQGELTFEAVAGKIVADYLHAVSQGVAVSISVDADSPHGSGPAGRAWRTASIQRSFNYATDAAVSEWRDTARRLGIVSNVAVPLCPVPQMPVAILVIYCPYIGGFQSEDQQAFIDQVKSVLDLALSRLAPPRPGTALLPFFMRERWRNMVATGAVLMHYQPVVRLADGVATELEALARLRADDGGVLLPGAFLPALGDAELVQLFHQALLQAMACRARLAAAGFALDMSVNAPAAALEDARYPQTAAAALEQGPHVPGTLLLEILESPVGTEHTALQARSGMQALKAQGFRLVEDDLGAGFSSLIRLRQWPFDRVKIDQAIVLQVVDDPLRTLRFIRQLIRLGHDLGLEVVVEGLETRGMIEAALVLGADLGQGYALARPMAPESLGEWLRAFRHDWDASQPRTTLGMLAAALVWEEQFAALPPEPVFWQRHAASYLDMTSGHTLESPRCDLCTQRDAMRAASAEGPHCVAYRQARERYFVMLVDRALAEEKRGA